MIKIGDSVVHHAYGSGLVIGRKEAGEFVRAWSKIFDTEASAIIHVKWDNPELGRFPEDELPWEFESFWTDESQLEIRKRGREV